MNTVIMVSVIVVTAAIVVLVAYLVRTLNQVKRTAREAELLLKSLNQEVNTIGRITGNVSAFIERLSSPWVKAGSWAAGVASSLFRKQKKEKPSYHGAGTSGAEKVKTAV